jgi:membrane-associated phospholipid phosphatase
MVTRREKHLRKMIILSLLSAILFTIMYFMTNHSVGSDFHNFMRTTFGMTNKWSKTYGPDWLVNLCDDISGLGGHINFVLIVGFVSFFLFYLREQRRLTEFLFAVIGSVVLLTILKFTMNPSGTNNIIDVFITDDFGFPSGHALTSLVLYATLAKFSGRKLIYTKARYVIYVFASVLIFLIGVARLFTSHTATEVIAGWCAGIFWLSIVNYFFRKH